MMPAPGEVAPTGLPDRQVSGPGLGAAKKAVLNVKGLSAGYGPMRVIHDLDLIVYAGERVGLVGLNGHGKSTLFYAIAGLTGWQRGSIRLNGTEVGRTRSQGPGRYTHLVVRQGLALIPQGDEIFHGLTAEEHLDSGAFTPRAWRERAERKRKVLDIFPPLRKLLHIPVGRLSGGERRMVSIGRGLMAEASLFLVDEPSLGLAPKIGKGVMAALMSVELGDSAMVIAEQNISLLQGRVDRIIGMHVGKLKGEASVGLAFQIRREA
jgi:branched-chain amino acid transport system ATP-binding protein